MKPETAINIRKLAREATIFALLGMVVAAMGVFVVMDNGDRTNAKRQAAMAVHAGALDFIPENERLPSTVQVPLSNGIMLEVRACQPNIEPRTHINQVANDKDFLAATKGDQVKYLSRIDSDFAKASSEDQLAYLAYMTHETGKDRDKPQATRQRDIFDEIADQKRDCRHFFTDPLAIRVSVPTGNTDQLAIEKDYWSAYKGARHQGEHQFSAEAFFSLLLGLWGFPAGLALWIFYRLVRFAVKG